MRCRDRQGSYELRNVRTIGENDVVPTLGPTDDTSSQVRSMRPLAHRTSPQSRSATTPSGDVLMFLSEASPWISVRRSLAELERRYLAHKPVAEVAGTWRKVGPAPHPGPDPPHRACSRLWTGRFRSIKSSKSSRTSYRY
jgi:hypothetical protein